MPQSGRAAVVLEDADDDEHRPEDRNQGQRGLFGRDEAARAAPGQLDEGDGGEQGERPERNAGRQIEERALGGFDEQGVLRGCARTGDGQEEPGQPGEGKNGGAEDENGLGQVTDGGEIGLEGVLFSSPAGVAPAAPDDGGEGERERGIEDGLEGCAGGQAGGGIIAQREVESAQHAADTAQRDGQPRQDFFHLHGTEPSKRGKIRNY